MADASGSVQGALLAGDDGSGSKRTCQLWRFLCESERLEVGGSYHLSGRADQIILNFLESPRWDQTRESRREPKQCFLGFFVGLPTFFLSSPFNATLSTENKGDPAAWFSLAGSWSSFVICPVLSLPSWPQKGLIWLCESHANFSHLCNHLPFMPNCCVIPQWLCISLNMCHISLVVAFIWL